MEKHRIMNRLDSLSESERLEIIDFLWLCSRLPEHEQRDIRWRVDALFEMEGIGDAALMRELRAIIADLRKRRWS